MRQNICIVAGGVVCLAAVAAQGQVAFVSRSSVISANSNQGSPASASTSGFDPFDQTVSSNGFRGNGGARQNSSLTGGVGGGAGVNWSLSSAAISVFGSPMSGGSGSASAGNTLTVTFDVASAVDYTLSGSTPMWPGFVGSDYIRLSRLSGVDGAGVLYQHQYPDVDGAYFNTGALTPGRYELAINFSLFAGAGAVWSFDSSGSLTITPAPGAAAVMGFAGLAAARRRRF